MKFEKYIDELLARKVFPGITIIAGSHSGEIFRNSYGYLSVEPEVLKLRYNSIYDVASLTKPLITTLLILILEKKGFLRTGDPVNKFLEGFPDSITISDLITHSSGIPAWHPLYLEKKHYVDVIKELKPVARPGKKVIYSCLGYILLAETIRKVTGRRFSEIAEEEIIHRLELRDTFFRVPSDRLKNCVPTGIGNRYEREMALRDHREKAEKFSWREDVIIGEVNDGNSYFLKGESGNAGLFSTADDIFSVSRQFYPDFTTLLDPDTALRFWRNLTPFKRSHRSFGFKLNSSLITSGGRSLSKKAIGHSGFTGTSIWMEPDSHNVFILLTNRIHPVYDPGINFNSIRRKLHKLIKKDLGFG
ncbi:MAG: serine hydrolase domain-containing protein [Acidobacteriota bacterium]